MKYQRELLLAIPLYTKSAIARASNMLNETCGPASIVVELEQTLYMVSLSFIYAKTDVKISSALWPNVLYRDKCSHTVRN